MGIPKKDFELDLWKKPINIMHLVQHESAGREVQFKLLDDGRPYNVTGKTVMLEILKPDHNIVVMLCDVVDAAEGIVKATIVSQAVVLGGEAMAQIRVSDDGQLSKSFGIRVLIAESINADGIAESTTEFTALQDLIVDVQSWENKIDELDDRVSQIIDLGRRYGVRRTLNATSPTLERILDSIGLSAPAVPAGNAAYVNDFDNIYPWSHMRDCKITADKRIHYVGDPGYDAIVDCDWMIEVPKYYLSIVQTETYRDIVVSQFQHPGYWLPQIFKTENGTEIDKIYVAKFKTSTIDGADVSRPGLELFNRRGLASYRTGAQAKGAGWQLIDASWVSEALHPLYMIEAATLHSQSWLGAGVTSTPYSDTYAALEAESGTNRIIVAPATAAMFNIGELVSIGTARGGYTIARHRSIAEINVLDVERSEIVLDGEPFTVAIGNVIWMGCQLTGSTLVLDRPNGRVNGVVNRSSNKYRGMEDPFGQCYEWVDGILINDRQAHVCRKPSQYASALNADYKPIGYTNSDTEGYPREMGFDHNFPEAQFPVLMGGGTSTGYCDYYYHAAGLRGASFGGYSATGASAGLFHWHLLFSPTLAYWYLGSRLLYKP